MNTRSLFALASLGLAFSAMPAPAADTSLDAMPAALESQYALSGAPPRLRANASVYLLDPKKGYHRSQSGTSGVACIVQRTQAEHADFRNDIYYPICFDAAGTKTYLRMIMDTAALRAQGLSPAAVKAEIEKRFADKTYVPPAKPGVSYMIGPVMRTKGPPDMQVHTMAMPHLMFYAPYLTNADLGAAPDFTDPSSLVYPFADIQGSPEHTYMIQLMGETERAKILADEKPLIDALCAYKEFLCLNHDKHH